MLDTDKGLVIINCCSHGGVANIIQETMTTFPDKKVYGLIGGFHLFNKSESEIRQVAEKNKCTGEVHGGQYFYSDKPIFINKIDKALIVSVLNDIIQTETELDKVFTKVDRTTRSI